MDLESLGCWPVDHICPNTSRPYTFANHRNKLLVSSSNGFFSAIKSTRTLRGTWRWGARDNPNNLRVTKLAKEKKKKNRWYFFGWPEGRVLQDNHSQHNTNIIGWPSHNITLFRFGGSHGWGTTVGTKDLRTLSHCISAFIMIYYYLINQF